MAPGRQPEKRRKASKEERKAQLIEATMRSIALHGLSDTTMATVVAEAGLSQGIVNLHFQSKERLLLETLAFVVDDLEAVVAKVEAEGWWYRRSKPGNRSSYIFVKDPNGYDIEILQAK